MGVFGVVDDGASSISTISEPIRASLVDFGLNETGSSVGADGYSRNNGNGSN